MMSEFTERIGFEPTKAEKRINRYYDAYMKFSRRALEGFAKHEELNIDIQKASKEGLAMALAQNDYDIPRHLSVIAIFQEVFSKRSVQTKFHPLTGNESWLIREACIGPG